MLDYEGLTVRDLKRIVNRGEATPAAIGLFVLYDYWEREHGRRAIVDNKLLRYIESKWAFSPYANELDFWLELGAQLRVLELQAIAKAHETSESLYHGGYLIALTQIATSTGRIKTIYAQMVESGYDVSEYADIIAKAEADERKWPEATEIMTVARETSAHVESFLAYLPILRDVNILLGISLTEKIEYDSAAIAAWIEEQEAQIAKLALETDKPDIINLLKWLIRIDLESVSTSVLTYWASTIAAYLSPNWRGWARAGVSLRELADSSKGIGDLIRHAEIAAVELDHE